ncbi:hypothetical protein [Streptomyces cinereoruber]|uniref:hypothetical protein n=1 Tax=Streptomyces cinereoruber TaxID=67260 RepID=UPI003640A0B9
MPNTVPLTTSRTERTMTTTTAHQLQQIARHWPDLTDALGTPATVAGFGLGLRGYLVTLNHLDHFDAEEAAALRALERSPDQLGARPVPISLRVLDTMRTVETVLHETADQIAAANQHDVRTSHPHRWQYTGHRPGAIHTALWLSARATGAFWPGRPLTEQQHRHLATVAAGALHRIEAVLDLADLRRELTAAHPCPCGGTIEVYGGAGATPVARCKGCGAIWSERGILAA